MFLLPAAHKRKHHFIASDGSVVDVEHNEFISQLCFVNFGLRNWATDSGWVSKGFCCDKDRNRSAGEVLVLDEKFGDKSFLDHASHRKKTS